MFKSQHGQEYVGYAYSKRGGEVQVLGGYIDVHRKWRIDGARVCALVGPRGGLRGWVTLHG